MITRIIVGLILGAAAALVIWKGNWIYFVAIVLLALLGMLEFYRITRPYHPATLAGLIAAGLMLYCAWYRTPVGVLGSLALGLGLTFVLVAWGGPRPGVTGRMAATMLGPLWVAFGFAHLLMMHRLENGTALVLTVVFGTWAGDTMGYFVGKYFGSTPMAPRLSPRKTWEGYAGGVLGTVIMVVFIGLITDKLSPSESLLVGLTIAVVGPIGDLFESLIKRDVDVKDAGSFLPGHGGVLDRFDALLFSAVAVYYLVAGFLQ
jgi:phosphatidate cytidylyltransferase